MSDRPSRMTPERYATLFEAALARKKWKTLKALSVETGFSPTYCQEMITRINRGVKITVSRETNLVDEAVAELGGRS